MLKKEAPYSTRSLSCNNNHHHWIRKIKFYKNFWRGFFSPYFCISEGLLMKLNWKIQRGTLLDIKNDLVTLCGWFWCKMMRGIQKSWSQCSTMLTFWEIKSFLKKWLAEICGKKQQNHIFQKNRNFAKSKRCSALRPTFLDSSPHFTSITPFTD